ncbi:transmembrane protein 183-like isoform X1 [Asterias rubens]|uniref:transmembrane protein 183-like isoform X1 n=1 Tax=Asterias rubens TaxID=7604 RepID=UPI001455B581|nr:transmembrane protein 183-like isoform X1 [Asterias rubens]
MPLNSGKQRGKRSTKSRGIDHFHVENKEKSRGGWQKEKGRNSASGVSSKFVQAQDVTLQAFADNASCRALSKRTSKAATMSIRKEIKLVDSTSEILKNTSQDDVIDDWFDREFSDDDEVVELTEMVEKEDTTERVPVEQVTGGHSSSANAYPTVIWYLVSAFIYPEDISTFACLCRDTYALTNTAGFWRKLYFRYWSPEAAKSLPKELHYTSIQRTFGLRTLVIRSLQFIYPPFAHRNTARRNTNEAVENMSGLIFMYHVSRRKGSNYVYYLKFQETSRTCQISDCEREIFVNPNRDQWILKIMCKTCHRLEPERIMGKELVNASFSVSYGMMYNKLKLEFQEPMVRHTKRADRTILILDPVLCARVYPWWHPLFNDNFRLESESGGHSNGTLNMWNANN